MNKDVENLQECELTNLKMSSKLTKILHLQKFQTYSRCQFLGFWIP